MIAIWINFAIFERNFRTTFFVVHGAAIVNFVIIQTWLYEPKAFMQDELSSLSRVLKFNLIRDVNSDASADIFHGFMHVSLQLYADAEAHWDL